MKKITFTPVFNLKKNLNKNGEAVITVKAYQDGRSKYFSTHLYVKPS
ncbi:MAG: Arm DNA-binding domain-containing protein, partial [Saprospiraceae bacterium]